MDNIDIKEKLTNLIDNLDYDINRIVNMLLSENIDSVEYANRKSAIEDLFIKEIRKLCL